MLCVYIGLVMYRFIVSPVYWPNDHFCELYVKKNKSGFYVWHFSSMSKKGVSVQQ